MICQFVRLPIGLNEFEHTVSHLAALNSLQVENSLCETHHRFPEIEHFELVRHIGNRPAAVKNPELKMGKLVL